jgi:hypothetical protein
MPLASNVPGAETVAFLELFPFPDKRWFVKVNSF